jgi:hypothetical protein
MPQILFPSDPRLLGNISNVFKIEEISKDEAKFSAPKMEASDVIKRIELYWNAKVNKIIILNYPYFVCRLITQDGSQRFDIVDAVSGKLREI